MAADASAEELAGVFVRVRVSGESLRRPSLAWFVRTAERLSLDASLASISGAYALE